MLFCSQICLLRLWNQSAETETPGSSSCVAPRLYWSTYGRLTFGSYCASDTTPKFAGIDAKLISHPAVRYAQPVAPCAMSSPFESVHVAVNVLRYCAGLNSDANVVVAAAWNRL